jgi:hypothetical protein
MRSRRNMIKGGTTEGEEKYKILFAGRSKFILEEKNDLIKITMICHDDIP